MLNQYYKDGFIIIGFGASSKGNTLLNALNSLNCKLPEYIVDENP